MAEKKRKNPRLGSDLSGLMTRKKRNSWDHKDETLVKSRTHYETVVKLKCPPLKENICMDGFTGSNDTSKSRATSIFMEGTTLSWY